MKHNAPSLPASPMSSTVLEPSTPQREPLVKVASFGTRIEADIAKSRLEAAGLLVVLGDEHTVGIASHLSQAVGGVKLFVAESDVDRARGMLAGGDEVATSSAARIVFRVRGDHAVMLGIAGMVLALPVGWVASTIMPGRSVLWVVMAAMALVGMLKGRALRADCCSSCASPLPRVQLEACPGCRGSISGEIGHRNERLAAEEALRLKAGSTTGG